MGVPRLDLNELTGCTSNVSLYKQRVFRWRKKDSSLFFSEVPFFLLAPLEKKE
jgi:hypothetical protein